MIHVNDPDRGVVANVASVGDKCTAQHGLGALDSSRIPRARIGGSARKAADVIAARVEPIGLGGSELLDQLIGRRSRPRREPQRGTAARAIELSDLAIELSGG